MTDTLTVWWGDDIVGSLRMDRHGDTSFCCAETWLIKPSARAISISLPLRAEPFSRRESRPFFEGLLPEEHQRSTIARALGLSVGNEFRLLEALGGEVAGALALWPKRERPPAEATSIEPAKPLNDDALIGILNRLPIRPMLAGDRGEQHPPMVPYNRYVPALRTAGSDHTNGSFTETPDSYTTTGSISIHLYLLKPPATSQARVWFITVHVLLKTSLLDIFLNTPFPMNGFILKSLILPSTK